MRITLASVSIALLVGLCAPALAQDKPEDEGGIQGLVSAGAGLLPEYEGASSYMAVPYFEAQANLGNYFFRFMDGAFQLNLIDSENFHAGPLVGVRLDRDKVTNDAVSRMRDLPISGTVGGYVEYEHLAEDPRSGERVSLSFARGTLNYQSGWTGTLRAMAHRPLEFINPGFIATIEVDTTWGDARFFQTYFGVTQADALASGLPQFRPGSGISNAGGAIAFDQFLSRKWSVGVRFHYAREIGDAADSPLTAIAGSPNQYFCGVVIGYVL